MRGLAARAPGDSVRPRRLAGASVRPLNFTVRHRRQYVHTRSQADCRVVADCPTALVGLRQGSPPCESEPHEALALILVMVEMADQPLLLERIGAGPLEDLPVKRGADVIAEVEARARDNAPFRTALSHVWISDGNGELNQRLAALGCRVVPIRPRDDA